jgi:DNA-binding winged helix-turn-helix (wHTH) protein/tetratricopeptide (TPR) repeat protein
MQTNRHDVTHVAAPRGIRFGRYHFHATQGLTRGRQQIRVTPKSLAVLSTLLERSGEVVTREELFREVWPDTAVSDAALTTCIQELRRALDDDARHPKYIETVHRRGFRFLAAAVSETAPLERLPHPAASRPQALLVGRGEVLIRLSRARALASEGRRQIVFVTGEPGIGKTALVDAWLTRSGDGMAWRVARAECLEHHGAGEAYQPLLEALTRLCTQPHDGACLAALRHCAPTWLAQLPSLQTPAEHRARQRRAAGATSERMLRELTDAFEMMTDRSPLVLCLEDLHWSDAATLDWIASFARRPEPARILVIGTYRPGEADGRQRSPDSLADDLSLKGLCTEIELARLDAGAVQQYVMARFPPAEGAREAIEALATVLGQRTEGNPLFIVNALNDLIARNLLVVFGDGWMAPPELDATSLGIPADIRRTIERQIDRMDADTRRLLEVASLSAGTCAAAAVAAGAGVPPAVVEETFAALAKRHTFVRESPPVEWPDGTVSATYDFLHALYRDVLSARPLPTRRVEVHHSIGTRLEAAYGNRATERAAELALHFEFGRDLGRAVQYLQHAAETDRSRSAHQVAEDHYRRALALLDKLPRDDERDEREVSLRVGLGSIVMQTSGWGAPEVQAVYSRVRELSEGRGPGQPLISALWHLWIYSITRGELDEAGALADRLVRLSGQSGNGDWELQAHHAQWSTLFTRGDLEGTERHARAGLALCEANPAATVDYGGHDTGICARVFRARVLALGGRTDAAVALCDDAVSRARERDHPFTLAFALMHVAAVHEVRRDARAARMHAAEAAAVAREYNLGLMRAWATGFLGWSMAQLGEARQGLPLLADAVAAARASGSTLFQPHLLGLLTGAQTASGLLDEGLQTVEAAFTISAQTGERFYIAELHRLRGELRRACNDVAASSLAEDDFRTAIDLAQGQGAHQLALRAAVSLARLLTQRGRASEAIDLLPAVRSSVAEGRDVPDVIDADAIVARERGQRRRQSL